MLQANAPTYRVQTFLIKCTLNGYIRCNMSAEFQRRIWMEQALTQLDVKILFDDFTYHAYICNAL